MEAQKQLVQLNRKPRLQEDGTPGLVSLDVTTSAGDVDGQTWAKWYNGGETEPKYVVILDSTAIPRHLNSLPATLNNTKPIWRTVG